MTKKVFTPSKYQQAFFDWIERGRGSAIVVAVAGAGKTTSLIEGARRMRGHVYIAAYNRSIAKEVKARLQEEGLRNVWAGTFHSYGFITWNRYHKGVEVDEKKSDIIFNEMVTEGYQEPLRNFVTKAVSLAKQRAIGYLTKVDDWNAWMDMVDHFDLVLELEGPDQDEDGNPTDLLKDGVKASIELLRRSIKIAPRVIDYDDMIYMPLVANTRLFQQDWLLVDEAQDTNPARRAFAKRALKPGGRLVAVGDPHQAIYGFTGADADALHQIKREFNCIELPLTVSYRCPKKVVALAKTWVSHIEPFDKAPDGIVGEVDFDEVMKDPHRFRVDDAVICRKTAPLVDLAFALIRKGIACHVEGKDIGKGLIALATRWKVKTLEALEGRLSRYKEKEVRKWMGKGQEKKADAIADRVDTVLCLIDKLRAEGRNKVEDLTAFINGLFQDEEGNQQQMLTLSTVHKSKGREWRRVYILGRSQFMPSPFARQDWQKEQEDNLCYVAVTRAKEELIDIVIKPRPKKEEKTLKEAKK